MPELPEVEVVKRSLNNKVQNLIIKKVKINDSKLRYRINKNEVRKIIGLRISKIERRSKFLLFFFNKNITMLVHLGMTGKFFFINQQNLKFKTSFYYDISDTKEQKHDRIVFFFNKNKKLIYNDVRKFGFIKFIFNGKPNESPHLNKLGPEPLQKKFNYNYFKEYIKGKNRVVKDILMDQKFVSGIGNIYASEILFLSKIDPTRKVSLLQKEECKNLIINSKKILFNSIKKGGSSIKNFTDTHGESGSFQKDFKVYGREGLNCKRSKCYGVIKKKIISNRSTFFCDLCQK